MPKYRNTNTGDLVEYDTPSPRLEQLPNWERIDNVEQTTVATVERAAGGVVEPAATFENDVDELVELRAVAAELGITVDRRWKAKRLNEEIAAAQAAD